jgi:hypothetical protein
MRTVLGLLFTVVVAACGGTPEPSTVVVQDRDASATPVATTPAPAPVSPELAALQKCDGSDPALKDALERAKKDRALADALWSCFDRFRASEATSASAAVSIAEAVLAAKDASWGPKAVAKLAAPVKDPKAPGANDQLQYAQGTSVRLLGELRYAPAVRPLVMVLLDDKKASLVYPVRTALAKMAKDAEPVLIAALTGTDAELATAAKESADQAWLGRVADALAAISRPAGRDAILDVLPKTSSDAPRAALAVDLPRFPTTPRSTKAFTEAYAKVPPNTNLQHYGGMNAHSMLAAATPGFFDPTFVDWLLKENTAAKGEAKGEMPSFALPAAIKLMTKANANAVGAAVSKLPGAADEKQMYKNALAVVQACDKDVACYLKELAKPTPAEKTPVARMAHVKAAWMAGVYGDAATRNALVERLNGLKDGAIRGAILEAIDHLTPTGDAEAADKIDALVGPDRAANAMSGLDEMANLALRLRARSL